MSEIPKRKTHDEFLSELFCLNPDIEVIGHYINNRTKIDLKCRKPDCGYQWKAIPHNLLNGCGCPKCGGTLKISSQDFANEVLRVNPNIILTEPYSNFKTKIQCRCTIDGHVWSAFPQNLLRGHGCPLCSANKTRTRLLKSHDDFVRELSQINPNVLVIGAYKKGDTKILCECKIDGFQWNSRPSDLLHGKGCPECKKEVIRGALVKPHSEFVNEMKQLHPQIKIIGKYVNSYTKILCECKIDGNRWFVLPSNLIKGQGCPVCNESRGENAITNILKQWNVDFIPQFKFGDCKNTRPLPFDFYLPKYNMCIEYDGEQHFRAVNFGGCSDAIAIDAHKKTILNDEIKNKYCREHNIELIRISYVDFNRINEILENIFQEHELCMVV